MGSDQRHSWCAVALAAACLAGDATAQCLVDPDYFLPYVTTGARFGSSAGTSDGYAVVGLPYDLGTAGSALVLYDNAGVWEVSQFLRAADEQDSNFFGSAVAVAGPVTVIGAPGGEGAAADTGAAYVHRLIGGTWVAEQKLFAADGAPGERFGAAVATDGTVVVVGAEADDPSGPGSGSAYVFRFDGTSWVEEQKLVAADGLAGAQFGAAVAVRGGAAACGAPGDDDLGPASGSVAVFRDGGGVWTEEQKLVAADGAAGDQFGRAVGLDVGLLVAGAPFHPTSAGSSGDAYVFRHDGAAWAEEQRLGGPGLADGDRFGASVAVEGDLAVVGAPDHDAAGLADAGAAWVFRHNGSFWAEQERLLRGDAAAGDALGAAVAVGGADVVAGAPLDDDTDVDVGAALIYPAEALALDASSAIVLTAGYTLSFLTCAGDPGNRVKLFLVDANGTPTFLKVASGRFDGGGVWVFSDTVPPGYSGLTAKFLSLGFHRPGQVGASNPVLVVFL